ncbi:MAG TPA: trigger factor [Candidatus Saccharimonadales bacterium]
MKTSVKHLSKTRVQLTISVDKKELEAAEQVALVKLARDIKVPGFRKGKVPPTVAAKNVDPNVLAQETADNALSRAVAEAFISEDIQALDRPEVELKKYVPGQEMEFTAEVDVVPPVKLGDYKKLGVKTEKVAVAAKEVDEVIERMRSGMAERKEVKRAAKNGDVIVIDFVGKKDGTPFEGGKAEDYDLELGSNSFIPGFEEGLVGAKAGDKKDLKLKFPESYHVDDLAGADVVFETTVKKVEEKQLPELDDEFAKKVGASTDIKTFKELQEDIKKELLAQKEREAIEKRKDDLVQALVDVSELEAPQVLVDDQVRSIEQDMQQNLMYRNITLDQYIKTQGFKDQDDWKKNEVIPAAEKRVKAGLVLSELAKILKVDATDEEKEAHLNRYRMQYANNPEMAKRFDEPEVQRDVYNRLLTEKTVEELVELNK